MIEGTDVTLEFLALIHPAAAKPADVYNNLELLVESPPSRSGVYRVLEKAEENGYVELVDEISGDRNQYYRITDNGVYYLEGEIKGLDLDTDEE